MRIIKRTDKILSMSHSDADGVAAQIVLGNVFENITYNLYQFDKIDNALLTLDFDLYDHVFLTDIYPTSGKLLDRSDKIIYLDHHETGLPLHNPRRMRFVDVNQCGATITKSFVEAYFKIKIPYLDKFVFLIEDYDRWQHKDPFSRKFNALYGMYRFMNQDMSEYRKRFMHGNVLLTDEEVQYLERKDKEYHTNFDSLEMIEFNHIKGAFILNATEFLNEIAHDLMTNNGYRIIFLKNLKNDNVSLRHNIQGFNAGELLVKHNLGGGHPFAAGFHEVDSEKLVKHILTIEKYLYVHFPEVRLSTKEN